MRLRPEIILILSTCLLLPAAGCLHQGVRSAASSQATTDRLIAAKAEILRADYRADLAGLARLRETVAPLATDPDHGYLAHYWSGFASWRTAINGATQGMSMADMRANLERAAVDFEASIAQREGFADGYAAAAGVDGWLTAFRADDPAAQHELLAKYQRFLARAKELEPENPRVLWVEASPYLFLPVGKGGDPDRAIALYRRMVQSAAAPVPARSPLPDWGKPEAQMSLAYAHLNTQVRDLEAAEREAQEALRLEPDWHYVKNILLPQIAKARAAKG